MTVCVAVKVHDCIVFAADSATSLVMPVAETSASVTHVYNHGVKVFNLHKQLPIVAMTAGMGHFGSASISNLAKDLRIRFTREEGRIDTDDYTVAEIADAANAFFAEKYRQITPTPSSLHSFEFWIGGYGSHDEYGEIWKLAIVNGEMPGPAIVASSDLESSVLCGGQTKAISRLLLGFDPEIVAALAGSGLSHEDIERIRAKSLTPLVRGPMPVQDAIDLADFLVDVTKKYTMFLPGANVVGGDTDIATVTKHEGFKWIKRKHYYPSHLNPKETDHAS